MGKGNILWEEKWVGEPSLRMVKILDIIMFSICVPQAIDLLDPHNGLQALKSPRSIEAPCERGSMEKISA